MVPLKGQTHHRSPCIAMNVEQLKEDIFLARQELSKIMQSKNVCQVTVSTLNLAL